MNYPASTAPQWVQPLGATAAPSFDQLLADARIRMAQMPQAIPPAVPLPVGPIQPVQPIGGNWRENSNLPPGLRNILNRMPPEVRQKLEARWASRNGGNGQRNFLTGDRGADRQVGYVAGDGGGRDFVPASLGSAGSGTPSGPAASPPAPQAGGGFGGFGGLPSWGGQNLGKGWRGVTAGLSVVNPFAGLLAEGARRGSNVSYANKMRDMVGIERPSWWDSWKPFSKTSMGPGDPNRSIGDAWVNGRMAPVSYGGVGAYTPREAYLRQQAARTPYNGPYDTGGDGGGGGFYAGGSGPAAGFVPRRTGGRSQQRRVFQ